MKLSVFTPVHKTSAPFLREAWQSLRTQTYSDWEWIVLLNAGGEAAGGMSEDSRIKIVSTNDDTGVPHNKIGRLKSEACRFCSGDVLVELDADDMLREDAIEKLAWVFNDPSVAFAYSNNARFTETWSSPVYSPYWGWKARPVEWQGHPLMEQIAFKPTAHSFRRVEWAPNHVRAWRKSAYDQLGGHNPKLVSGDDHELCCRTYIQFGQGAIRHINECLYFYRVHKNTCDAHNAEVQQQVALNYLRFIWPLAIRWARDNNLRCVDLGGGINPQQGFETVDVRNAHIIADLEKPWPFANNSVGVLKAHHVLEHLPNPIHAMNEAYRVLAPGGWMMIEVPSAVALEVNGKRFEPHGAFRDPTHKSFWTTESFWYYTTKQYSAFIPEFNGRFQAARIHGYVNYRIPIVVAELIALKQPYESERCGEVTI